MNSIKKRWEAVIAKALASYAESLEINPSVLDTVQLVIQVPPKPELGDFALPLFPLAKIFRKSPQEIAGKIAVLMNEMEEIPAGAVLAEGPYLNMYVNLSRDAERVCKEIADKGSRYGCSRSMEGEKVMIEFSCPNTNKPLHLGHLRNDSIGMSTAAVLEANGAVVRKVNLINDRGVHICKSMLAYEKFSDGATPQSTGIKSDHFVGNYYVKFNTWAKEHKDAEKSAQELLVKWEQNDEETVKLWSLMNKWAIDGIFETYARTGVIFDDIYYESKTYTLGKELVYRGLESQVFYREEDGSVWVDMEEIGLDKKVLLRSDGTTLYLTQDLGTAVARHEDWPFDKLIYVVGSEQQYHFKVLFHVLRKLGITWAENLYHLSYGMVNLPEGKMKSREGTVVDADDLIKTLTELARLEIIEKNRQDEVEDLDGTAAAIAQAALNYYLLQVSPAKDMIFNPAESIAFNGNTGPYLQYMGARISSMLRKYDTLHDGSQKRDSIVFNAELLNLQEEHQLIKQVLLFPDVVEQAGKELNPTVISAYLYELSRLYSKYYHDHQILRAGSDSLTFARVVLSEMVLQVLKNAFALIGIPFLEKM
ncbi:MAG: arginine--tRNA ligase [Spirochaetia bacterium]|nr:arginine--tRNA ligase [Spirochaetia bacterium]